MSVVCIIPARGGSKRVPGKNLARLNGLPLIAHSVIQAVAARSVDEVLVSTDHPEIAAVARAHGAEAVQRPAELASDEATSESALIHVLDILREQGWPDPELIVFLQCTSPIRRSDEIDRAVAKFRADRLDSLFSACLNDRFVWAVGPDGPESVNYDYHRRQREQDLPVQYKENGSIYICTPKLLRETNNRLGGRIGVHEMDYWSSFQVDSTDHLELIEWIMSKPAYRPATIWPERISLVIFDFDGVMTDNRVYLNQDGLETVACNRGDGWGIGLLRRAGVKMMVLSTEPNPVVLARCRKLKLDCHHGIADKGAYLSDYLANGGIDPAEAVYLGNDSNDLACLKLVGLPAAVADAHPSILPYCKLILSRPGGDGAVRELCDLILDRVGKE